MGKFEELRKKYDDDRTTYDAIDKEYNAIMYKRISADIAAQFSLRDIVTAILEEVTVGEVDLYKGVAVKYFGIDGVFIFDKATVDSVRVGFYELTKSGKVSAKEKTYFTFYFDRKTGDINFDGEIIGTPEKVVEYLKNNSTITFK